MNLPLQKFRAEAAAARGARRQQTARAAKSHADHGGLQAAPAVAPCGLLLCGNPRACCRARHRLGVPRRLPRGSDSVQPRIVRNNAAVAVSARCPADIGPPVVSDERHVTKPVFEREGCGDGRRRSGLGDSLPSRAPTERERRVGLQRRWEASEHPQQAVCRRFG